MSLNEILRLQHRVNGEIILGLILRHPLLRITGMDGGSRAGKWHRVSNTKRIIIEFKRLRLSLKFLIYLFGTGHFLKPEGSIPVAEVKKSISSYLLNEASDKDNHYYGEYNLTHKA